MADPKWREFALLGLLALLWGSSYLFIKIAVTEIPPLSLIALRVSIAAVLLLVVVIARGYRLPRSSRVWGALLVQSFFNAIGAWTVLAWGQQFVDSGLASVLNSTSPIFVFFFLALLGRSDRKQLHLLGALLGVGGVILIMGPSVLGNLGTHLAGQAAILLGAILYACAAINGRRFHDLPAPVTAFATMAWASVVLIPLALVLEQLLDLRPSITALGASLILSVVCTGFALLIYFRLLKTIGSMGVASQSYLRAGVGVLLGIFVLGETLEPLTAAGLVLAIAGVVLINLPGRIKTPSEPRPPSVV